MDASFLTGLFFFAALCLGAWRLARRHPWQVVRRPARVETPPCAPEFVLTAVRALPAHDELRRGAERFMETGDTPSDVSRMMNVAFAQRQSLRRVVVATWLLGHSELTGRTREATIELLRARARSRGGPFYSVAMNMSFAVVLTGVVGVGLTVLFSSGLPIPVCLAVGIVYTVCLAPQRELARAAAVDALGRLGGPDDLALIATLYRNDGEPVRDALTGALCRLLERLTEEDFGRLGPRELARLSSLLPTGLFDLDTRLLNAFKVVGTPAMDAPLRRYARRIESPRLAELAGETLACIGMRAQRSLQSERLVRPAAGPHTAATLVRPAARGAAEEPLVRAVPPADISPGRQTLP